MRFPVLSISGAFRDQGLGGLTGWAGNFISPRTAEPGTLHRMPKKRRTTPNVPGAQPASRRAAADLVPAGYADLLAAIKQRVQEAQVRAAVAVNRELVLLYWQIGRDILRRQQQEGWGAKVIDRLAADLHAAFPSVKGFSARNLKYMRALADAFPDEAFVQEALAQITWYHAVTLLEKVADPETRAWYVRQTIAQGWSRNVLVLQIEAGAHRRQGKALTNFPATLPSPQSDLARDLLKDPYHFDFLTLAELD